MLINTVIIVFNNVYVSNYPFSYFIILKVTNKKIDNNNNPIRNKVVRDKVYKFFKTFSLSYPNICIYLGKREMVEF